MHLSFLFSLSPGRNAEYRKQQLKTMFGEWEMDRNRSVLIRKTFFPVLRTLVFLIKPISRDIIMAFLHPCVSHL